MNIPCAFCKISFKRAGIEPATEVHPFCSKCWDDYAEALDYGFEKTVEQVFDLWEDEGQGIHYTEKVKEIIPTLDTQNVTPGKIGRLRGKVRKLLEREIGEIDGVVEGLVG